MDVQQSVPGMVPSKSASTVGSQFSDSYQSVRSPASIRTKQNNRLSWNGKQQQQQQQQQRSLRRIPSMDSTTTMVTAPNAPHRRFSRSSSVATSTTVTNVNNHMNAAGMRPPSTMSQRSDMNRTTRRVRHSPTNIQTSSISSKQPLFDETFDNSVNPWATSQENSKHQHQHRYGRTTKGGDDSSNDSIDEEYRQNQLYATPTTFYQQTNQQRQHDLSLQSPIMEGSATSVTTIGAPSEPRPNYPPHTENRLLTDQQYTSVVALGPATKRALETLQAEIIALNERIDGLRQELMDRDQLDIKKPQSARKGDTDDNEVWNAWKWVLKAALKHTTVNLMTVFFIVFFLYRRGNPIAYAITGSFYKQWSKFKLGFVNNI
ncbi:hypothetical protein BC941DRAFT_435053, partial [Chlamydoabsidia padenii]